jgi:hypothetical protein
MKLPALLIAIFVAAEVLAASPIAALCMAWVFRSVLH